ncbi:protein EMBRYONIC FLOWER 1 isoform X2 [Phaseolus vulgaris]
MLDAVERREIDLNTALNCINDYLPNSNEKGKKAGVVPSRIIDLDSGLEDNLNHQVTSVPSPKKYPDLTPPEVHTTKKACEGNEVSFPGLSSNLKCMEKSSSEMCNGGIPAANQSQNDLIKACTVFRKGATIMEEVNNTNDHPTGPPIELVACNDTAPAGSIDNTIENDFQDHHSEKSTGLSRRRPRKVRLMSDLLSDNGDLKTEQNLIKESVSLGTSHASAASQAQSILLGKVDIQEGLTLTSTGPSRKRKFPLDEVRRPTSMGFQRIENEVQNSQGVIKTTATLLDARSNFKYVPKGLGLQDVTKGHWNKTESERSRIISKKKNKRIQGVDNRLISEQPVGQHRENVETMDTTENAYASKTNSSRLVPLAFTGKTTDKFPTHSLRIENEFNLSKAKGKMLQTDPELDSFSWQKNNMLVQDSCAYSGEKVRSTMPLTVPIPSAQEVLNRKGLKEGLHLSLNNYLVDANVYNKKCIHQIESRLPFSMPFQDGTSKVPQLKWKDSDTDVFGGQSIPSKNPTNALSGKAVHCEETNSARSAQKTIEAVYQLGFMKRYSEQTREVSEQETPDGIPMDIVELMAKNQYERCLPDVENRSSILEKPSLGRKGQLAGGSTVQRKGEMSLLKEGQKEKPQGKHKKNSMIARGENVKPSKRKPGPYFTPFDGNNLGMNNLCPPQSSFGLEVSQSQKKPSGGLQFSAIGSTQLGSAQNCRLNGNFEERGSPNATFQAPGGCSLHNNILHQDDEASRIWASLTPNHVSPGYDLPKRVVSSQHPSCNMNLTSLQSGAFHKQNTKRDTDLNYMNLNAAGLEKLSRNIGSETFSRMNGEYPFPCKHSGMEPHQNLRGSLDLYSNDTIPAMHLLSLMDAGMQSHTAFDVGVSTQMLKRPSYPGDCNTKLEIGTSKPPGTMKRSSSDYCSRSFLSDKHGCFVGPPTFGASSSTPHEKKLVRATGFNGQNPTKSGKKEKMKNSMSTLQNKIGKQISWPHNETETSLQRKPEVNGNHETPVPCKIIPGNTCMVNRNPADLTIPETGNIYMIRGEDLKFEKSIPRNRLRFPIPYGYKQQKNLKGTKMKEHSKH